MATQKLHSFLAAMVEQPDPGWVHGRYPRAVLVSLVRCLSDLLGDAAQGVLFVSTAPALEDEWTNLQWTTAVVVQRLPSLDGDETMPGVVFCCGVGAQYGFVVYGHLPLADQSLETALVETHWSCDPTAVLACLDWAEHLFASHDSVALDVLRRTRRALALHAPDAQALLNLSGKLMVAAAQLHAATSASNHELAARLRWREDQTRMVVHDMRAPLHTLNIGLQTLLRHQLDAAGQRELLEIAQESTRHLLGLSENLLQISRLEAGIWQLKLLPLDLGLLVRSMCRQFEHTPRPNQPPIRAHVPAALPPLHADQRLLERVLINLIANAVRYTPATGEITVSARQTDDGDHIELKVSDTGQSIAPEVLPYIFGRFYQARSSDRGHGIGFGLYFCRLAIEAHGGTIEAASTPGSGSTFTVLLPREISVIG